MCRSLPMTAEKVKKAAYTFYVNCLYLYLYIATLTLIKQGYTHVVWCKMCLILSQFLGHSPSGMALLFLYTLTELIHLVWEKT